MATSATAAACRVDRDRRGASYAETPRREGVVPEAYMRTLWVWLALGSSDANATEVGSSNPFGLGVILGDPTGLSGKYYIGGPRNAIDVALSFDTYGDDEGWVYVHASYLWHPSLLASGAVEVPWFVGVGGVAGTDRWDGRGDDDDGLGVRVPVGIDVNLNSIPLQFFGEIALNVFVIPRTDIDLGLGIGARYYF